MDGRHDFSPLDRGRFFSPHHHGTQPHHGPGPGPTPPPPPPPPSASLLSPSGFPDSGSLARQSLVELARANSATPGGGLGGPGSLGHGRLSPLSLSYQSRYLPGGLPLHSPRSAFPSLSPYLGAGGAGPSSGGNGTGSGGVPTGPGGSGSDAGGYKSMLPPSLPGYYWPPPPPPSPLSSPLTEGLGPHGLHSGGYLPLLAGAESMSSLFSQTSAGQGMPPYHRIYDLHKEALLGGLATSSSSIDSRSLFALPHTSCGASCYTSGCPRASMPATLELQEQARAIQLHQQFQQQEALYKLQEEHECREREAWEREDAREREGREREREQREREERERDRRREREKQKDRERREKESSPDRPKSRSSFSTHRKRSPEKPPVIKTEDSSRKSCQRGVQMLEHVSDKERKSSPGVGVVRPSKSKTETGEGRLKSSSLTESNASRRPSPSSGLCPVSGSDLQEPGQRTPIHEQKQSNDKIVMTPPNDPQHCNQNKPHLPLPHPSQRDSSESVSAKAVSSKDSEITGNSGEEDASRPSHCEDPSKSIASCGEKERTNTSSQSESILISEKVKTETQAPSIEGVDIEMVALPLQNQRSRDNSSDITRKSSIDDISSDSILRLQANRTDVSIEKATVDSIPSNNDANLSAAVTDVITSPQSSSVKVLKSSKESKVLTTSNINSNSSSLASSCSTSRTTTTPTTTSTSATGLSDKSKLQQTTSGNSTNLPTHISTVPVPLPTTLGRGSGSGAGSASSITVGMSCLKKQLSESIPCEMLVSSNNNLARGSSSTTSHQRSEPNAPSPSSPASSTPGSHNKTSRHDPPRPVLTSALQSTRRLLHSPEITSTSSSVTNNIKTSQSLLTTSTSTTTGATNTATSHSRRLSTSTTTTTVSTSKLTPVTVVTSSGPDGSVYAMYPSTKPMSMVYLQSGVTSTSGDAGGGVTHSTRTTSSHHQHRSLGGVFSYSHHVSGSNVPETGPRKVHATTFTPEVGTVHQGPITSPVSSASHSSSQSSGVEHGKKGSSGSSHRGSSGSKDCPGASSKNSSRPCLSGGTSSSNEHKSNVLSPTQHMHTVKQRLGHPSRRRESEKESSQSDISTGTSSHGCVPGRKPLLAGCRPVCANEGEIEMKEQDKLNVVHVENKQQTSLGKGNVLSRVSSNKNNTDDGTHSDADSKRHMDSVIQRQMEVDNNNRLVGFTLPGSKHRSAERGGHGVVSDLTHDAISGNIVPKEEGIEHNLCERRDSEIVSRLHSDSVLRKDEHRSGFIWPGSSLSESDSRDSQHGSQSILQQQQTGASSQSSSTSSSSSSSSSSLSSYSSSSASSHHHPRLSAKLGVDKSQVKEEGESERHHRRPCLVQQQQQHISQNEEQEEVGTSTVSYVRKSHDHLRDKQQFMNASKSHAVTDSGSQANSASLLGLRSSPGSRENQTDVKPVLVQSNRDHGRLITPVQPVVNAGASVRSTEAKEGSHQNEDTPPIAGSNIPVGIAIARKRGDRRPTQEQQDDGGSISTETSDRPRHANSADTEGQRDSSRDKNVTAKSGVDIGPNLVVTGGSRPWGEGDDTAPSSNPSGVGPSPWLTPGPHPSLPAPVWLGQGGFPLPSGVPSGVPGGVPPGVHPSAVDPSGLAVPPPGGLKLAQDPMTGQFYVIPEVPLAEAGRVWPAGFPGHLQGQQQLQYLQQQYAQHLQQLQQQQQQTPPVSSASGGSGGSTGGQIKTEAPCRQEEQAAAVHYQQMQRRLQQKNDSTGPKTDPSRGSRLGPIQGSNSSPDASDIPPFSLSSGVNQSQQQQQQQQQSSTLPPGDSAQNQSGPPFIIPGLGQPFPGLPFPAAHLPYYLDPSIVQQLRNASAGGNAVASTSGITVSSRTEPVTVQSRGTSPIIFPEENLPVETSRAVSMTTTSVGTSEVPMKCTMGCQTSQSPVLEMLRAYSCEEGTQTTNSGLDDRPSKVEVGVQLSTVDSDSDSNSVLTMPLLTARTVDCGTQADGCMTGYSGNVRTSSSHYDSDRRSASPQPPSLVAEGSPRHHPDITDTELYGSDCDIINAAKEDPPSIPRFARSSYHHTAPGTSVPQGKGLFDLGVEFLDRQILEVSDGLDLLSTVAEHASREQSDKNKDTRPIALEEGQEEHQEEDEDDYIAEFSHGNEEGPRSVLQTTDTEEDTDVDINRNYNVPKPSMFMESPSIFTSKFPTPVKKDALAQYAQTVFNSEDAMDAAEIEMRMRLAELQRKYKEKQRELAKLQPRRDRDAHTHLLKRGPGRPRKRKLKKSSKSESHSKSPRSESTEKPAVPTTPESSSKKKKKDSSEVKLSRSNSTPSKSKSKSGEGKASSSKRLSLDEPICKSEKSNSKRRFSVPIPELSHSLTKSSKSGSSKSKSSKGQSKKKEGKSSSKKKSKKEDRDPDLDGSELEDVSWLFDEDEINPPPSVLTPSLAKKPNHKRERSHKTFDSWPSRSSGSTSYDLTSSPAPPVLSSTRSPYSFTESYDDTSNDSTLGLLSRYGSNEVEVMKTSVAAATSAALKSKKRKKRPGAFGDPDDAPVKKRKPGRPKKFEHELITGVTETIVDKKSKSLSLLHINTNTAVSSCGSSSSSSSSSSSTSSSCFTGTSELTTSETTLVTHGSALASSAAIGSMGCLDGGSTCSTSSKKKSKPWKEPKRTKFQGEVNNLPFLEEEWGLRRSERIFLSGPSLHSPSLPDGTEKTTTSPTSSTSSTSSGSIQSKSDVTTTVTATVTPVVTPVSTPKSKSSSTSCSSSVAAGESPGVLKGKTSSKVKGKLRTVHDLSQKVKKKYSKSSKSIKTGLFKTAASIKSEPLESRVLQQDPPSAHYSFNKMKYDQVYSESDSDSDSSSDGDNVPLITLLERPCTPEPRSCVINKEELRDGLRVLIYMEGLFYEGQAKAIEPPDVYGVVIDGERGSRPHILSQEEILNEAVLDVPPPSTRCLREGTRVCAYWSQQFSCLYPGTVAKLSPNPATDKHFVSVEFDDGDSGRIPIEHIRMLPRDYPIVTVGPSPMLVLGKRRRRTVSDDIMSDHKDRKSSVSDVITCYQATEEPKSKSKKSSKSVASGSRSRDDAENKMKLLPTIQESGRSENPIDEYDAAREFGPDPPKKASGKDSSKDSGHSSKDQTKEKNKEGGKEKKEKDSSKEKNKDQVKEGKSGKDSSQSGSKKKHKHKEKKKDKTKKSGSSGGDDHKHKHHHHHHHHKKHKHRKSSTESSSSKSTPSSAPSSSATTTLSAGANALKASFLSPATSSSSSSTSKSGTLTSAGILSGATKMESEGSSSNTMATTLSPSHNVTMTATSPGSGEKLTVRIRTNSTDVHPLSPNNTDPGSSAGSSKNKSKSTPSKNSSSVIEKAVTSKQEKQQQQQQEALYYSEDDSPDTSSDGDDDDDSDFRDSSTERLDAAAGTPRKKKSSMSMARSTNKRRQTKRKTSVENKSKIAAFLPARQLWRWSGNSTKRPGMKGKAKKEFYKAITRGKEIIRVGDCAVFLSTGRPHLPYVGRIESLWEAWGGNMVVKVKWFYHPEETKGGKKLLEMKGALYQSPHVDENDVQTISHKCEVMQYTDYSARQKANLDLDNEDVYYLAGTYEPTIGMITLESDVKLITDVK